MKILGLDFGQKWIGLAISEGELAQPLGVEVKTASLELKIKKLCLKEGVGKIVVGISEGKMAKIQKKFAQRLREITGCPVEFEDETLTSKEALRKMFESQTRKKKRKFWEHAVAATIILQNYLQSQKPLLI